MRVIFFPPVFVRVTFFISQAVFVDGPHRRVQVGLAHGDRQGHFGGALRDAANVDAMIGQCPTDFGRYTRCVAHGLAYYGEDAQRFAVRHIVVLERLDHIELGAFGHQQAYTALAAGL